jgi:periplasmic divalent cation tolerance protein
MDTIVFVYVTCPSEQEAETVARTVVESGLAACANLLPGMRSIYRWQGRLETAAETVLLLKTTSDRLAAVVAKVRELHSYQCPCIAALPIAGGHGAYLEWIAAESEAD